MSTMSRPANGLTKDGDVQKNDRHVEINFPSDKTERRIRPQINAMTARKLAESLYRLTPKELTELDGYVDRNYFINASQDAEGYSSNGYVLKILNAVDTKINHVEAEHAAMRVLIEQGFKCPTPILNVQGQDKSIEKIYYDCENGDCNQQPHLNDKIADDYPHGQHTVHLLNFVPGKTMGQVLYTPSLLFNAGRLAGQLHEALKDFTHPGLEVYQLFNLDNVHDLRDLTHAVSNSADRALVHDVIEKFTKEILQKRHLFQRGVIHGDFGMNNIIVQESPGDESFIDLPNYDIYGIIDFGYIAKSYYIYELGIAIMYAMLDSTVVEPLDVGGHILAGYLSEMPLCEVEINSVMLCVAARFAQSLTIGAYNHTLEPTNPYILLTARNGWTRLRELWSTSKSDVYDRWTRVLSECYGMSF